MEPVFLKFQIPYRCDLLIFKFIADKNSNKLSLSMQRKLNAKQTYSHTNRLKKKNRKKW